jgi:putative transposase
MARLARVVVPHFSHHVTQRGNGRRDVFYTPTDRQVYLGLLKQYSELYALRILGYCLMTNHVHLVAVPQHGNSLSKTLREVHGRYATYRNALDRSSGHLWQSRYYSCAFEEIRLAAVLRYVELNPVRAGLVSSPSDYAWSSAALHLGGADPMDLVDLSTWRQAWMPEQWARMLSEGADESGAIREATYGGRPLGSADFVSSLEQQLGRKLTPARAGRRRQDVSTSGVAAG